MMARQNWLDRLTDRLVLCPSEEPLDPGEARRMWIPDERSEPWLAVWQLHQPAPPGSPRRLLVKFPGMAGRAERSTVHPAEAWSGVDTLVWTVNPPGYGDSRGEATIQQFPAMIDAVAAAAERLHPDRAVIVWGNSLGSISALAWAARYPLVGLGLRNPVPLAQMIRRRPRYAWPTLGFSRWVADRIPHALDTLVNAGQASAPCLTVSSGADRVVPIRYQRQILAAYGGPLRRLEIPGARHGEPVPEEMHADYAAALNWLIGLRETTEGEPLGK